MMMIIIIIISTRYCHVMHGCSNWCSVYKNKRFYRVYDVVRVGRSVCTNAWFLRFAKVAAGGSKIRLQEQVLLKKAYKLVHKPMLQHTKIQNVSISICCNTYCRNYISSGSVGGLLLAVMLSLAKRWVDYARFCTNRSSIVCAFVEVKWLVSKVHIFITSHYMG
jgi:hypothetical protein